MEYPGILISNICYRSLRCSLCPKHFLLCLKSRCLLRL